MIARLAVSTRTFLRRLAPLPLLAVLLAGPSLAQDLPRAAPEAVGMSSQRLDRLTEVLESYVEQDKLPGGVALVARDGRIAYLQAFGFRDREAGAPMTPETLFRIASQTKALVSVGVLTLQEEGRLLLTDPLHRWLPEFDSLQVTVPRDAGGYDLVPAHRPPTLLDLLTHSSGYDYGYGPAAGRWAEAGIQGWYFADREEPMAAVVARMADLPLAAQPGERFVYGYSTDILGVVIERVSGLPLDVFLRERILEPLGMDDTWFYPPASERRRLATVYSRPDSATLEPAPEEGTMISQGHYIDGPRRAFSAGAGLVSTAGDYARFLQMLLNGGELDGVRILAPASVRLMTADHLDERYGVPGEGFGLGFSILEEPWRQGLPGSPGEFGWGGAYHSTYWVDPEERLVVVYLTQVIPARALDDYPRLRALIYASILR